jgi:glutamine synthetase
MVRVPHFNGSEKAARIELRCPDTTISPHLGIAAVLAAGLEGIKRDVKPPEPIATNLYRTSAEVESLPASLKESLLLLKESQILKKELGESVIDTFVSIRMKDWEQYVKATKDPRSSNITSWELERYLHAN